jgi:hypothetical protein
VLGEEPSTRSDNPADVKDRFELFWKPLNWEWVQSPVTELVRVGVVIGVEELVTSGVVALKERMGVVVSVPEYRTADVAQPPLVVAGMVIEIDVPESPDSRTLYRTSFR